MGERNDESMARVVHSVLYVCGRCGERTLGNCDIRIVANGRNQVGGEVRVR